MRLKKNDKAIPKMVISKKGEMRRLQRKDNWQLFTLTIPGLVLMALFNYLPMFGLVLAFKKYKASLGVFGSPWAGLDNFKFFFTSGMVDRLLKNTLGMNLLFLAANTVVTVLLALLMYELKNRMAIRVFQTCIFMPFIISWAAASYALYANLSTVNGILNSVITFFGGEGKNWYITADAWPTILLICYLWKNIGYGMIIYYGNLMAVDSSYFEAATLDGANRLQMARYISWPFIRPTVIMFTILTLGRVFSADFGMFYYMTMDSSALYETTDVIDTYVYRALTVSGNVGMSTAIGLLQSTIGLIILVIANKLAKKIDEGGTVF